MPLIAFMTLLLWLKVAFILLFLVCALPVVSDSPCRLSVSSQILASPHTPAIVLCFILWFSLQILLLLDIMGRDICMSFREWDHLGSNRPTCWERPHFLPSLPWLFRILLVIHFKASFQSVTFCFKTYRSAILEVFESFWWSCNYFKMHINWNQPESNS